MSSPVPEPDARATLTSATQSLETSGDGEGIDLQLMQPPNEPTGSLLGAIALVAGTTVGAGILALPAKTLEAGFLPTAGALFVCWCYMAASGLLIAEVNMNTMCALGRNAVSIKSMADDTLGVVGSRVTSLTYVFIHCCLLIAYMLQGGALLLELLPAGTLPAAAGAPLFAGLAGGSLLFASSKTIDRVNSLLVVGVVGTFGALLALGAPQVRARLRSIPARQRPPRLLKSPSRNPFLFTHPPPVHSTRQLRF